MRNQDLHNALGLLTEDQYRQTFEVTGDGSNFMGLSNSGAIARALVTYMHETGYIVEEMVRDDGDDAPISRQTRWIRGCRAEGVFAKEYLDIRYSIHRF